MENNKKNFIVFGLVLFFFISTINILAQDVPGGTQKVPIGGEVRNGKLLFKSDDGNFSWWFDARVQFDGAMYFENKNALSNGVHFRRVTFAMKTQLWKNWQAEVDLGFGEKVDTKSQVKLRDAWVKYTFPTFNLSLQAGNFKEPFGMERLNSSRLLPFLERTAITDVIALGRRAGISARYWTDYAQLTAAIMGHETGTRIDKGQRDETFSANIRASLAPINNFGENLHFGLAYSYKIPDVVSDMKANTIEMNSRVESEVFNPKFLHTGDITNVNYYDRYGFEFLFIRGPFLLQSEFMGTSIYRWYGNPTVNLKGGYVTACWVITGENRYYYVDEGEVGPIEAPKNSFGAFELAARYSVTNLNDHDAGVKGGQANQLMLGLNYYPNNNIKIQFNYSMVNHDQYATRKGNLIGDDDFSFIQMRIQAAF
ncbi:MAG: porin [Ignavibacteriaceae bacterium]|jgi:phosphate-selective porin OprO/OprP|nr:porin [Ignavibacteriaceae bacterium]